LVFSPSPPSFLLPPFDGHLRCPDGGEFVGRWDQLSPSFPFFSPPLFSFPPAGDTTADDGRFQVRTQPSSHLPFTPPPPWSPSPPSPPSCASVKITANGWEKSRNGSAPSPPLALFFSFPPSDSSPRSQKFVGGEQSNSLSLLLFFPPFSPPPLLPATWYKAFYRG